MRALVLLPLLATACGASSAVAADRGYSINDFDRIHIEGPYDVQVHVGPAAAVHAHGSQSALDRLDVSVNDGTLVIRTSHEGWGGWPGAGSDGNVTVIVTTPALHGVALAGSGETSIDRMRGGDVQLNVAGSGNMEVGALQSDTVGLALSGSGRLKIAGSAKQARVSLQGSGDLDASGLSVQDATVSAAGSGNLKLAASRTAKVQSAGSGDVAISGAAACEVSRVGSGDVACGKGG